MESRQKTFYDVHSDTITLSLYIREQSLFMVGVGTEEKVLCDLKTFLPHHLLKSNFPYPTER